MVLLECGEVLPVQYPALAQHKGNKYVYGT